MWKAVEWVKALFGLADQTQQNKTDNKVLREQMQQVLTTLQLLIKDQQHLRETEELKREQLRLEILTELLKRLPPPPPPAPPQLPPPQP